MPIGPYGSPRGGGGVSYERSTPVNQVLLRRAYEASVPDRIHDIHTCIYDTYMRIFDEIYTHMFRVRHIFTYVSYLNIRIFRKCLGPNPTPGAPAAGVRGERA